VLPASDSCAKNKIFCDISLSISLLLLADPLCQLVRDLLR
jgi:hypothetical protein